MKTHAPDSPLTLTALSGQTNSSLRALHEQGTCPDLNRFDSDANGLILGPGLLARLNIWRGKRFVRASNGDVGGYNRLAIGPLEVRRYRFVARIGRSAFSQRQVLLLDHDNADNPAWVRAFHDEMVELHPGLYLASSHQWVKSKLRFRSYFALALPTH